MAFAEVILVALLRLADFNNSIRISFDIVQVHWFYRDISLL